MFSYNLFDATVFDSSGGVSIVGASWNNQCPDDYSPSLYINFLLIGSGVLLIDAGKLVTGKGIDIPDTWTTVAKPVENYDDHLNDYLLKNGDYLLQNRSLIELGETQPTWNTVDKDVIPTRQCERR